MDKWVEYVVDISSCPIHNPIFDPLKLYQFHTNSLFNKRNRFNQCKSPKSNNICQLYKSLNGIKQNQWEQF